MPEERDDSVGIFEGYGEQDEFQGLSSDHRIMAMEDKRIRDGIKRLEDLVKKYEEITRNHESTQDILVEALQNMVGVFDTPLARRQITHEFAEEARASARKALEPFKQDHENEINLFT